MKFQLSRMSGSNFTEWGVPGVCTPSAVPAEKSPVFWGLIRVSRPDNPVSLQLVVDFSVSNSKIEHPRSENDKSNLSVK